MTRGAARLMPEEMLSSDGSTRVEAVRRGGRHAQSKLVVEQRRKFRRHQIRRLRNRETDPRIAEASMTTHLSDADVTVPIGDRTVGRERFEADTLQPEDR